MSEETIQVETPGSNLPPGEVHMVSSQVLEDGSTWQRWSDGSIRMVESKPGQELATKDDGATPELNPPPAQVDWEAYAHQQEQRTQEWQQTAEAAQAETAIWRQKYEELFGQKRVQVTPRLAVALEDLVNELTKMGITQ
jgi:phosphoglycolate phosphatase-like HAD superfamily hydrolase